MSASCGTLFRLSAAENEGGSSANGSCENDCQDAIEPGVVDSCRRKPGLDAYLVEPDMRARFAHDAAFLKDIEVGTVKARSRGRREETLALKSLAPKNWIAA